MKSFTDILLRRMFAVIFLLLGCNFLDAAEVYNLRCEYLVNPLGVDVANPRLSWMISSQKRGEVQTAYEILVASSSELLAPGKADVWKSGKITSDQSIQLEYQGASLHSNTKYYWKVRVWDKDGQVGAWSAPAFWSMGLLTANDWGAARWIAFKDGEQWKKEWKQHKDTELSHREDTWPLQTGQDHKIWESYEEAKPHYDPSPLFRKTFSVSKQVKSAYLYICGLGYYEAFLNGERIGNHVLDPAWTNFDKRSFYVVYNVTSQLHSGKNAMGVMLGRGQYNPLSNDIWGLSVSSWVDQPKVMAVIKVKYTDGSTQDIVTDQTWKTTGGPIVFDDTRKGEMYDARREQKGWTLSSFNDNHWQSVALVNWNAPLQSQMIPPIRCFASIAPKKVYPKGEGRTVYDIGKNIAGWARVKVSGPAGAKVLVEYSEMPSDRELVPNVRNNRMKVKVENKDYNSFYDPGVDIRQQNGYILKGEGVETFECHYSYKGFQFIRITADKGVKVVQVEGVPVHTDVESTGSFTCSNSVVNRIQENSRISLLNNFHSIATDCPHREKQGWTADNYISCEAAMYNFNMASFYT
ncbi:MAG: family 78 glycoside hydrolase catalytic domain, partial [Bacteroidota bacterium]|nr:family 78 glycoside hydrolase catalytic domain [Bacteroidota bacterium]